MQVQLARWSMLTHIAALAHGSKPHGGTQLPRSQALSVGQLSSLVHPTGGGGSVRTAMTNKIEVQVEDQEKYMLGDMSGAH